MTPEATDLIAVDPGILHGEPHVRGTRVPVKVIRDSIAAGMSQEEVLREYPTLTEEGLRAALGYRESESLSSAPSMTSGTAKEPAVSDPEDTTIYNVVVNDEEQYSIWPAHKEIPAGWRDAGKRGTKQECLDHVSEVWTDMRPKSLRDRMDSDT